MLNTMRKGQAVLLFTCDKCRAERERPNLQVWKTIMTLPSICPPPSIEVTRRDPNLLAAYLYPVVGRCQKLSRDKLRQVRLKRRPAVRLTKEVTYRGISLS